MAEDEDTTVAVEQAVPPGGALSNGSASGRSARRQFKWIAIVFLAAFIMGLPTVRGGFVGGDDHRLVLNHVLVNRPSLAHAVELFAIAHRDLYQPLPLLSFSLEFVAVEWLGLASRGPDGFAWLFHLDNVLLHAINAVLVWFVVRGLQSGGRRETDRQTTGVGRDQSAAAGAQVVATVAALLFAVHPLQTEVVAWTNGRMLLLSTLFALLTLLTFRTWLAAPDTAKCGTGFQPVESRRPRLHSTCLVVGTVLFCTLCGISKVRVGLPILLLIVAWAGRRRVFTARFLTVWLACVAVTGALAWVNIQATSAAELFSGGEEQLRGPRMVRVILAITFYFTHYLWPVGLASYYPTPPYVAWSDPATWRACLLMIPVMLFLAWSCVRSHTAKLGTLWFFATIFSTLPIIPARNILAADRYMYLPIIGLLWPTACLLVWLWRGTLSPMHGSIRRGLVPVAVVVTLLAMIAQCWNIEWYYETPLKKTRRIATLFPDVPRVWERFGWSHYELGHYQEAIAYARKELRHDVPDVQSGAHQLLGAAMMKLGDPEQGLRHLQRAVKVDPDNGLAKFRLASAYDELGRYEDALPYYEAGVAIAPQHNPTLHRLGHVYRKLHRFDDARRMYEREIENNAYELPAYLALAELGMEIGTRESLLEAARRLRTLLDKLPGETPAYVSLGAVKHQLGETQEAVDMYQRVLSGNPNHATVALNLAQIYYGNGDVERAAPLFDRAAQAGLDTIEQAAAASDFYMEQGQPERSKWIWRTFIERSPDKREARAYHAWCLALTGDTKGAQTILVNLHTAGVKSLVIDALEAYVALTRADYALANKRTTRLAVTGPRGTAARRRLLRALEHFDARTPNNPWTYCLTARLLLADRRHDTARVFLDLCRQHCNEAECARTIAKLTDRLP